MGRGAGGPGDAPRDPYRVRFALLAAAKAQFGCGGRGGVFQHLETGVLLAFLDICAEGVFEGGELRRRGFLHCGLFHQEVRE